MVLDSNLNLAYRKIYVKNCIAVHLLLHYFYIIIYQMKKSYLMIGAILFLCCICTIGTVAGYFIYSNNLKAECARLSSISIFPYTYSLKYGIIPTCESGEIPVAEPTSGGKAGIPNPASVFCEDHGGRSEIRTVSSGSQTGYCIFPDGSECEEWAFFNGECAAD
jgi:putative hemolysin